MKRIKVLWILLPCFALLGGGCKPALENGRAEAEPGPGPDSSQQVKDATRDLAGRLGVPASDIVLVRQQAVTWRDGSLGCPKKGMMYTQALVDGTLIVLQVDGKTYPYHSGDGRAPFYCENPREPAARPSPE